VEYEQNLHFEAGLYLCRPIIIYIAYQTTQFNPFQHIPKVKVIQGILAHENQTSILSYLFFPQLHRKLADNSYYHRSLPLDFVMLN
jgi:hypothetical protein